MSCIYIVQFAQYVWPLMYLHHKNLAFGEIMFRPYHLPSSLFRQFNY